MSRSLAFFKLRIRSVSISVMLAVALALIATPVFAQIDTGTIVGSVVDPSGAVVAGAAIVVTNTATNVTFTTQTNRSGQYQVPALKPGTYSVRVTAQGFQSALRNGIEITVQARPAVDFTLTLGQTTQTVDVMAESPLLQTETADMGGVYQTKTVTELPLNGRRYADLALLEAGIQQDKEVGNGAVDLFTANGNWATQNYFVLDGVDNNSGSENLEENSVQVVQPPPDAIEEFKIQTRTYSAEFGASAGAVVNVSIKSGTNHWHGDVWEFVRNSDMDANTFFNNADGVPRGHYSQNQFGGTIGGPIIKNRTFFFGDTQFLTSRQALTTLSIVPTPMMMNGNFNELPYALNDSPVAGQSGCVTNNIIAKSCQDQVSMNLLALWPSPNIPSALAVQGKAGGWTGLPNYQYVYSAPNDTHTWDFRVDQNINDNNRLFVRFSSLYQNALWTANPAPWTANPIVGDGDQSYQSLNKMNSVALSWTRALSATVVNEARAGFSRDNNYNSDPNIAAGTPSAALQYGLKGVPADEPGLPTIGMSGMGSYGAGPYFGMGDGPYHPQFQIGQVWQFSDNLSWLKGDHALKFGYEYKKTSLNFLDTHAPQGHIEVNGIYTAPGQGFGLPDLELGDVDTIYFNNRLVAHNYMYGHSFYAQDTWRVRKNLTINYGVRYELFSPVLNHQNQMADFTPANGGGLVEVAPNASGWYARSLLHPNYHNLAPRFGFSYQPTQRLVLRGGYGVFFQHNERVGSEAILAQNLPYLVNDNLSQAIGSTTPVMFMDQGLPVLPPGNQVPLPTVEIKAQDPNERTSYVQQVSFGPEIQLSPNTSLEITYVGNFAYKLNRLRDLNQGIVTSVDPVTQTPNVSFLWPNLNTASQHSFLEVATNDGNSNYHGLLVSLRRKTAKGLGYGGSYTWSHSISNMEDNLTANGSQAFPQNAFNYSAERSNGPVDIRHHFVAYSSYELPVGKGHALLGSGGVAARILGDWQLNGIVTVATGVPFEINTVDMSGTAYGHNDARPNCLASPFAGTNSNPRIGPLLNFNAFSLPDPGKFGTCAPRNFHAPGLSDVDVSLFKEIPIRESVHMEFRLETFNTFNHAFFNYPNNAWYPGLQGSFGYVTSAMPYTNPRQLQLALKLFF